MDLEWIEDIITYRLSNHEEVNGIDVFTQYPLPLIQEKDPYSKFIAENNYLLPERLLLGLSIASAVRPQLLTHFVAEFDKFNLRVQFGGIIKDKGLSFTPTLRTVLFLLAGNDQNKFVKYFELFHLKHSLFTQGIITLENHFKENSRLKFQISLNDAYLEHFFSGNPPKLDEGENFPAKLSPSKIDFEDLVLSEKCNEQLKDILKYLEVRKKLFAMDGVPRLLRTSYVAVFTGEPGTGKTITARTLGKKLDIPVYVVNLARIVSKYIGETEKNLERVFDRFNDKDCILFFDEADALFGKRTEVKDSKDRYANQEVAFLLQKIEEFNGVVILASNVSDINQVFDKAFQRRIRRTITFDFPEENERLKLWQKALPQSFEYETNLIEKLASNYQLTGASINNIIADTLIDAVYNASLTITFQLLKPSMEIEYKKTGRRLQECNDTQAIQNPQFRYGSNYMRGDFG